MKKFVLLTVSLFLAGAPLWAVPLSSLTDRPAEEFPLRDDVRFEEQAVPQLTLLPDLPGARELAERYLAYRPELTVQRLYRFPVPEGFSTDTTAERRRLLTAIVNVFGRPETQVDYVYRSSTRDEETSLFEDNYISDKNGRRQNNFQFTPQTLPGEIEYYQVVDEANFSKTVFSQRIVVGDNYLTFTSQNEERIWLKFIPLIGKGETRNELFLFFHDGYVYTFNCTQLEGIPAAQKLGAPVNLTSMFRKRMDVLARWMEESLEGNEGE